MPNYLRLLIALLFCLSALIACSSTAVKTTQYKQYAYLLPFKKGNRFLISQAFNGTKTHRNIQNRYAVDIVMPIGTPVCAARSGVVVEVVDSYQDTVKKAKLVETLYKVNYVKIRHSDNSIALYAHLEKNTVKLTQGSRITAGTCFAKSGNSGFSTGPHLHFAILTQQQNKLLSIPFQFVTPDGGNVTPIYLAWVYR